MRKKDIWVGIIFVSTILLFFLYYQFQLSQEAPNKIRIGVLQSWILEGPFYVAEEKGFYQQEGIDAEIIEIGSVDEFVPALLAKEIDVAELIADMFIVQATQAENIVQILRKATIFGVDGIVATNEIQSPKDLRGKKIAVQTISPSHYLLLNVLRDAGINSDAVTLLPTEAGLAGAAFLAGKVDVAVTWEPWLSRASERTDGRIFFSTAQSPELIYDILITRKNLTPKERGNAKAVLRAWFRALEWMKAHPQETIEIFSRRLGLPEEEIEFFFTKLEFMDYEKNIQFYGTIENLGPVREYTDKASQIWQEEGIISFKPIPEKIIDPTFLGELYK